MKIKKKYLIIVIWILLIAVLKSFNLISFDLAEINKYLQVNKDYSMIIFVFLWTARLFIFIPGLPFMILGGMCFGPLAGFLLSMAGIIISETVIYVASNTFFGSKVKSLLSRKYPKIPLMIKKYNYGFLALGMICPIGQTDIICFLSASTGMNYLKYIIVVILSNIPMTLAYSYMGLSFNSSIYSMILVATTIILISALSIRLYKKVKVNFE